MCIVDEPLEEFTSRHSLEWKFLFLDHRFVKRKTHLGWVLFQALVSRSQALPAGQNSDLVLSCGGESACWPEGWGLPPLHLPHLGVSMSWVWVRASQESHTAPLETSLGHPHLPHPHPTWDRRQVPLGKARCEGSSHFISFNTLRPFRPIFFLSCVTFFHS